MAVISENSIGDILHQLVDAFPSHTAPKGSLAIYPVPNENNALYFKNVDGSTTWVRMRTPAYGSMFYSGNTTATNGTQNQWLNDDARTWSAGTLSNFSLVTSNHLTYASGQPTARFVVISTTSIIGASRRNYDVEVVPAINNTLPLGNGQQGGNSDDATRTSAACARVETMAPGDYVNFGSRWTSNNGGGPQNGYVLSANTVYVEKIHDLVKDTIFSADFESGSFAGEGLTVVNGAQTNAWYVTTNDPATGTYSAHISNDGGTSVTYDINSASVTHFYVDVAISAGAISTTLEFTWKCTGEDAAGDDQYDYGRVFVAPTTVTPAAGTQVAVQYAVGSIKYNQQATFTTETIVLDSSYSGSTQRFIFSWRNDGSVGTNPPFVVDNISISELM